MPEFFASKFKTGLDHRGARVLAAVEQASIRFADAAFTCTDPMREQFVARGAPPDKMTVLLNGSDETVFEPARFPRLRGDDGEFRIISHGSVEERYGLDTVIRAMRILREEMPELRFHVYGSGTFLPALRELASEIGVADQVWFSGGFVPLEELVQAVADADVGVVGMKQDAFRDLTLANKMYDFIAMRTPQLVSRTRSVEAYFDDEAFAMFRSDDPEDLARAIREIRHDPERRARMVEAAVRQAAPHRWSVNGARYVSVLEATVGDDAVSGARRRG
jgi:glycosyltransferase involved in cell wall biosynthesis